MDAPKTTIDWIDPTVEPPPFGRRILAAVGSWRDEGRGFHHHIEIRTVTALMRDTEDDSDEGAAMAMELKSGDSLWDDCQFMLHDDDDDELGYFSDSIMWWARVPELPKREECSALGPPKPESV